MTERFRCVAAFSCEASWCDGASPSAHAQQEAAARRGGGVAGAARCLQEQHQEGTQNARVRPRAPSFSSFHSLTCTYVDKFVRQFTDLYPKRCHQLLCPRNECGLRKFICTTLRPTQLPFVELYDYEQCAKFVADFITYEPLELPTSLPSHLPSPSTILEWQAGDCFDMAQAQFGLKHAGVSALRLRALLHERSLVSYFRKLVHARHSVSPERFYVITPYLMTPVSRGNRCKHAYQALGVDERTHGP
eukprot:6186197-Pleurochrysis_carterae.AAC.1